MTTRSDRPKSAFLPKKFSFWPDDAVGLSLPKVQEMYENGFAGAFRDDVATEQFESTVIGSGGSLDGDAIAHENGLADTGAGKLILPFVFMTIQGYPGCLPGAAQDVGDCVSHDTKNAALLTLCCDAAAGKPDEVSGQVEGLPEVPPEGVKEGAFSTEAIYWFRGYNGHGWSCEAAANVCLKFSALWPRREYPELGLDLRDYSGKLASKYGSKRPPEEFIATGQKHLIRTSTRLRSSDEVRDFLNNGYGPSSCGSEGFSNSRDENGVSTRSGSWSHALAYIGFDDRDIIKQKYGEPLVLIQNSWARWNTGPRRILGTDIDIPEGSFWAKWSSVKSRSVLAFSGANGWPTKALPPIDLGVG